MAAGVQHDDALRGDDPDPVGIVTDDFGHPPTREGLGQSEILMWDEGQWVVATLRGGARGVDETTSG